MKSKQPSKNIEADKDKFHTSVSQNADFLHGNNIR